MAWLLVGILLQEPSSMCFCLGGGVPRVGVQVEVEVVPGRRYSMMPPWPTRHLAECCMSCPALPCLQYMRGRGAVPEVLAPLMAASVVCLDTLEVARLST